MMKKAMLKIIILSIAFFLKGNAQNLVPNGSFEILDSCPSVLLVYIANPWFQPQYSSVLGLNVDDACSSDLFNQCLPFGATYSAPKNKSGYQIPRTGSGYAGVLFYSGTFGVGAREYIEVELLESLKPNKKYCVEFYVSLMDTCKFAISNISAYFSNDSLLYDSTFQPPISVVPQINNDINNIIIDKQSWVRVYGDFVALGGEKFISIGNFEEDINSNNQNVGGYENASGYYIDDVSVICCDCEEPTNDLFIPNAFSPNNDGHNDILRVLGNASKIEFKVFDRWGEMVYSYTGGEMPLGTGWDGTYKGKQLDNAVFVYFAKVTLLDGKEVEMRGNVSLIK